MVDPLQLSVAVNAMVRDNRRESVRELKIEVINIMISEISIKKI